MSLQPLLFCCLAPEIKTTNLVCGGRINTHSDTCSSNHCNHYKSSFLQETTNQVLTVENETQHCLSR